MSGKASPSLRRKTLYNVERCNLSMTDKNCIREVFERYENRVEVVRCEQCRHRKNLIGDSYRVCLLHNRKVFADDFCSHGRRKEGAE